MVDRFKMDGKILIPVGVGEERRFSKQKYLGKYLGILVGLERNWEQARDSYEWVVV